MPRRLLLIQVDGLSGTRLARAIGSGRVPRLAALCRSPLVSRRSLAPSSTPAFQSALLYGAQTLVHGYAWFDRAAGHIRRFDVPEDIEAAERELARAAPRPPLLAVANSVSYFVIFIGGAALALLNLARGGLSPTRWVRIGGLLLGLARAVLRLPVELARALADMVRSRALAGGLGFEWSWLGMRVLHATFFEEVLTAAAVMDLRARAPMVFLDFVAYDEAAHRRGPDHPTALAQLARIDRRIGRLLAAAGRHGYDVVAFSDHGQAAARPFVRVEGRSLYAHVAAACVDGPRRDRDGELTVLATRLDDARQQRARVRKWPASLRVPLEWAAAVRARRAAGRLERLGFPAGEVAVVTGGSIAHIYVGREPEGSPLEAIEARFPRLVPALLGSAGVGFLVARRSARGALVMAGDRRIPLDDEPALADVEPFAALGVTTARHLVHTVVAMPSVGDLVLYGAWAPAGAVTFEPELGSHGGVHPDELDVFLVHSDGSALLDGRHLDPAKLHAILRERYVA